VDSIRFELVAGPSPQLVRQGALDQIPPEAAAFRGRAGARHGLGSAFPPIDEQPLLPIDAIRHAPGDRKTPGRRGERANASKSGSGAVRSAMAFASG
jgi:hypothetical protein